MRISEVNYLMKKSFSVLFLVIAVIGMIFAATAPVGAFLGPFTEKFSAPKEFVIKKTQLPGNSILLEWKRFLTPNMTPKEKLRTG